MGKTIEFPPGSGRVAVYEPNEQRFIRKLIELEEEGVITSETMKTEMLFIHDLKVTLGATMLDDEGSSPQEDPEDQPSLFGTESFPVPQKALEKLVNRKAGTVEDSLPTPLPSPDAPTVGRFHANPQDTEVAAAVKAFPRTGTQRRLVLDAIGHAGEHGLTNEEIGDMPGIADTAHRTRRKELEDGGWIVDSGKRRDSASKTPSIVWVLSERGRSEWRPSGA